MTKDRIKDLKKTNQWSRVSYKSLSQQRSHHDGQSGNNDGGNQLTTIDMVGDNNLPEYLAQIDLLRLLIDKIEELAKEAGQLHKKMLEPMADPKLAHELDDKTADIKKLAYDVSTKLKKMEQIQKSQEDDDKSSTLWRIKELQLFNETKRFRDVMNKYNQESVLHQDKCKNIIKRELELTGNRRTDEQIDEMIESGFPGSFSIMVDIEKAKQSLNQIEARHRDILKIEATIKELHDMFLELAQIVSTQGHLIDDIEHNVSKAVDFIGRAAVEVRKADDNAIAARKKKIIICVIIIAVVLILILIFGAYFTTQRKLLGR